MLKRSETGRYLLPKPEETLAVESEQMMRAFSAQLGREVSDAFLRRLALLQLVMATAAFGCAIALRFEDRRFGIFWLIVMMGQLILLRGLFLPRFSARAERVGLASILLGIGWVLLVALVQHVSPLIVAGLLLLVALGNATLPWPPMQNIGAALCLILTACGLFVAGLLGDRQSLGAVLALVLLCVVPARAVRLAAEQRQQLLMRVAHRFLGEYCESTSSVALVTLRLLTWQVMQLVNARRAIIATELAAAEVVEEAKPKRSGVDPVFARGFNQRLKDLSIEHGIVSTHEFGDQFIASFHDWFRGVPRRLFILKFLMVIDEREQQVTAAIPVTVGARLVGADRMADAMFSLSALARLSLSATRSRFLASDSLLLTQRSLSERETELNELVHLVNNVAQDISMQCEDLHASVAVLVSEGFEGPAREKMTKQVRELEVASRNLSTGVSDRKLIKELQRLRNFPRTEIASVTTLLEDLQAFGEYRARRRGEHFTLTNEVPVGTSVKVVSREFLETCLRALVRESFVDVPQQGQVRVKAIVAADQVSFEIYGFASKGLIEGVDLQESERSERMQWRGVIEAVTNFAGLSSGTFRALANPRKEASAEYRSVLVLSLARAEELGKRIETKGKWALFVDDNPQVTIFYGRVADALSLPFFAAASVTEARAIIEREGPPRLVISDLQLGEESGLDLVRLIRKDYGTELPVIVVSGNVADDVRSEVRQAGASNFLAKPVGRARLFAEIQGIMELTVK